MLPWIFASPGRLVSCATDWHPNQDNIARACVRIFAWADSEDAVPAKIGVQMLEEAKTWVGNLTGLSPADAGDETFRLLPKAVIEKMVPKKAVVRSQ
jgi:hypothetical protein